MDRSESLIHSKNPHRGSFPCAAFANVRKSQKEKTFYGILFAKTEEQRKEVIFMWLIPAVVILGYAFMIAALAKHGAHEAKDNHAMPSAQLWHW